MGAGTYDQIGYFAVAIPTFAAFHKRGFMAVEAIEVSDEFILRNTDGCF